MRISDWSSDVCSSDLDESPDWRNWLQAAGVSGIDVQRGPGFSDSSMVVEAAAAGQGVALGHRWLAAADLESGRIVMPFGPVLPSKFRSEMRRVGQGCVSPCRSRWSPVP